MSRSILLILAALTACKAPVQEEQVPQANPVSEQFIKANQYSQRRHQDHIGAFVERVGWDAEVLPSGLWIVLDLPGEGLVIQENDRVTYTYESILLDGTPCYEATDQNPKQIIIGKGGVEKGVELGMKKLREGADAIFLIPPHLGHGNFGDRDRIPGNSVLIYHVKILDVQ